MKQYKIIITAMAMLLVLAVGYSKGEVNIPTVEEPMGKEITIHVGLPDDAELRVAYEDTSNKLTWEEYDQLLIAGFYYDVSHYKGKSTFSHSGTPGKTSEPFPGTAINGAVKNKMCYPGSIEAGNVLVYDQQGTLKNIYSCTADNTRSDTIINKALTEVVQLSGGTIYLKGPFTFLIGGTVKIGDNTHLKGDTDVKIQPHDSANWEQYIPLIGNMSNANQNIEISGFQLFGNEPGVVKPPKLDRYYLCIILNGSNISIHNMHLSGNYGDGILIGHNNPDFNENILIYDNTINRIQHDAVCVNEGRNVQVYNNQITCRLNCGIRMYNTNIVEIYDNYITSNNEGGAGIQIQKRGNTPMDQINIYNNEIYKPKTFGIWIFGSGDYESSMAEVNVHHNKIYNTGRHGILSDGFNATVKNNVIDGAGQCGIIQNNVYRYPPPDTLTFGMTVKNNIISNSRYYGIRNDLSETHSFIISNNCFFNNTEGETYNIELPEGNMIADPQFADLANHDFHLKSQYGRWNGTAWINDETTSPCIDAGDPKDDFAKEPSPNGSRINTGVYGNTAEASKSAN